MNDSLLLPTTSINAASGTPASDFSLSSSTAPAISLIVCTRNRADKLGQCLAAISALETRLCWELLIVDNGSTDGTAAVIRDFLSAFPHRGEYLHVTEPGNGAGRNAAIRASRGRILAFTDDDCYVARDFLDQVEAVFRDEKVGYMSGRIYLYDATDYPLTVNESGVPVAFAPNVIPGCGLIQGANFSVRRAALGQAGGFDTDFGAGASFTGEDWELAMRISIAGWSGGYFPGPVVWHHHGRKAADFLSHFKLYGIGEGAVYAKGLLDSRLRMSVLGRWLKSAGGDILKRHSYRHVAWVVTGAMRYWQLRLRRWAALQGRAA